ncbi:hypothetical protein BGW42_005799, partial [Actinomortierella wolfii]
QNSQLPQSPSPEAETRPLPPPPAVVAVEEVRRGKRHSLSFRKPSRTKSLLAFVGRSRTNTAPQASSTTCTEQSSVSAKNLLHHHHHPSKPSVQHSELTSSSSPQFPSPQQLPDSRDLTASLAPQPQHQPHKASTRHRHQHSLSHSHSHSPSSPPLHHHNNNNNHSSTPQSAIPDDLRIHHSRSISMFSSPAGGVASPTTQASTAATGDITVPTSSQSSPARHSVVFPLDASARTHRSGTGPRQMDFDMLQQQRLRQAAATIFASTQAVAAAAAAAASQQGVRRGRSPSLSSLSSRCASSSSSSSVIVTSTTTTTTNTASPPTGVVADPWRDQWLGPSGAMQSLFRDRPSKFNCPHCGATKVRSTIEFVPGMMSFLVSFGLLFLTVGTLSFLPFRKDHKATKDCVHWCPRCETRVARFIRASGTWEWM